MTNTGWLPGLLGPLTLQVNGVAVDIPKRATVNIVAPGSTVSDDPDNDRTNVIVPVSGFIRETISDVGDLDDVARNGGTLLTIAPIGPGAITISGFDAPTDASSIIVYAHGREVTLVHEDRSAAANQISLSDAADLLVAEGTAVQLTYDPTLEKWFLSSGSAGAGPDFGSSQVETTGIGLFGQIKTTTKIEAGAGPFHNYDPGDNSVVKFSNAGSVNLTGIVQPSGGKSRILFLIAPNGVACFNEDANSSGVNRLRINVLDGSSVKAQILVYDPASNRWHQMAYPTS